MRREAAGQGRRGAGPQDAQWLTFWGLLKGSSLGLSAHWGSRQEGVWPRVGSVRTMGTLGHCFHCPHPGILTPFLGRTNPAMAWLRVLFALEV